MQNKVISKNYLVKILPGLLLASMAMAIISVQALERLNGLLSTAGAKIVDKVPEHTGLAVAGVAAVALAYKAYQSYKQPKKLL